MQSSSNGCLCDDVGSNNRICKLFILSSDPVWVTALQMIGQWPRSLYLGQNVPKHSVWLTLTQLYWNTLSQTVRLTTTNHWSSFNLLIVVFSPGCSRIDQLKSSHSWLEERAAATLQSAGAGTGEEEVGDCELSNGTISLRHTAFTFTTDFHFHWRHAIIN